jgi:hypothetical protein
MRKSIKKPTRAWSVVNFRYFMKFLSGDDTGIPVPSHV